MGERVRILDAPIGVALGSGSVGDRTDLLGADPVARSAPEGGPPWMAGNSAAALHSLPLTQRQTLATTQWESATNVRSRCRGRNKGDAREAQWESVSALRTRRSAWRWVLGQSVIGRICREQIRSREARPEG
ncbi:MAG: hypothetical protein EA417_18115, partial [Gammaproteobacteria bacterium]